MAHLGPPPLPVQSMMAEAEPLGRWELGGRKVAVRFSSGSSEFSTLLRLPTLHLALTLCLAQNRAFIKPIIQIIRVLGSISPPTRLGDLGKEPDFSQP